MKSLVYIYCITNLINNKKYIGKTNNLTRRKKEHFSDSYRKKRPNIALYKAIEKYGEENFKFKVIDQADEDNWIVKEKSWIKEKNSMAPHGYNISPGGDSPPVMYKVSPEEFEKLKEEIKTSKKPMSEIARNYGISSEYIWSLNAGTRRHSPNESYPLRKTGRKEKAKEAQLLLSSKHISLVEIADILEVSSEWVSSVNQGIIYKDPLITYPIYSQRPLSLEERKPIQDKAIYKILFTDIPLYKISSILGKGQTFASDINQGRVAKKEWFSYPLRKNLEKNKINYRRVSKNNEELN